MRGTYKTVATPFDESSESGSLFRRRRPEAPRHEHEPACRCGLAEALIALGAAMVLGAILALANTLHLAIDARREEILVVRVIGGSPGFIRRPFLYTGLYFGAGGGLFAGVMLWVLSLWIAGPVNTLFFLYGSPGQIQGPGIGYPMALIALGAGLGLLTSWAASARYFSRL